MSRGHGKELRTIGLLCIIFIAVLIIAPMVGFKRIALSDIWGFTDTTDGRIFWMLRFPRVLLAVCAGAALSISGMSFQAMFRNPLATPFTLGVSSGAAFGAAVYVKLGLSKFTLFGISGLTFSAFAGGLMSIIIVYGLSRKFRDFSTYTMLLAGVAVNFFFASLILFIQYISDFTQLYWITRWLMGGLEISGYQGVMDVGIFFLIGSGIIIYNRRELNLLSTGEEMAISRGVNINRTKTVIFFASSLMVGGVVAICGPIGFVGMMVPHICRLLIGTDHAYLTPASLLFGAIFLVICDTIARSIIPPAEIPVGVITALMGGPFFIWLLAGGRKIKGI